MECERFTLKTEEGELTVPKTDLLSLEVELDTELASMFRLRLAIRQQRDGTWTYLDEARFRIWKPLSITGGFDTGTEELISGYITHMKPDFPPHPGQCSLEIWGLDGSVLMDREEKLRAWPDDKDSAVATKIFSEYGFSSVTDDTEITHDQAISTIMQRETDMQFLKRLALRNGFECYVEGTMGFFRLPRLSGTPQPGLAVHFGTATNVTRFSLEVNALTPTKVAMFQVDRTSKEVLETRVEAGQQTALGASSAADLLTKGVSLGQVYVSMNTVSNPAEMRILCQELFHQAEWFVTAEGEVDGKRYDHVLKPRETVTIKGVGATYSGVYYVTHVTHTFTPKGYTQVFRVKRNALLPTGAEDFAGTVSKPNPFL